MARHEVVFISLDPPYFLDLEDQVYVFRGWAEVDQIDLPDIHLSINGKAVKVVTTEPPNFEGYLAGKTGMKFYAKVDFRSLFSRETFPEPFLLEAEVRSGSRVRTFEYAVTRAWARECLGAFQSLRAIPPEPLQIRVTGAAAGGYHAAGREVAKEITDLLLDFSSQGAKPSGRVLDLGCGPGRVIDCYADVFPKSKLFGCDIDPEAIEWASKNLSERASFDVNPAGGRLPYPDEYFDTIYSISIFTHLPEEIQFPLLREIRRVLKPGGYLITTKLNPFSFELPEDVLDEARMGGFAYWGESSKTEGLPDFYRLAYHSDDYLKERWSPFFEILKIGRQNINNTQDAVVARRPREFYSWIPKQVRAIGRGLVNRLALARRSAAP
jgi:SAM-dependent methyltransferase